MIFSRMDIQLIFLLFSLILIEIFNAKSIQDNFSLEIKYGRNRKYLIEFIEEGLERINTFTIKNNGILVLSENPDISPFSFDNISDNVFPEVINTVANNFSLIYHPGYKHNRGYAYETGSFFLLQQIKQRVKFLKFILILTYENLNEELNNTLKRFSNFVVLKNDSQKIRFYRSICIIIRKFKDEFISNDNLKKQTLKIISDNYFINNRTKNIFSNLIKSSQIEILSNNNVNEKVISMTNNLEYIETSHIEFHQENNNNFQKHLPNYTQNILRKFENQTQNTIETEVLELSIWQISSFYQIESLYTAFAKLLPTYQEEYNIESFLNESNILSVKDKNKLILRIRIISIIIDCLPPNMKSDIKFEKKMVQ